MGVNSRFNNFQIDGAVSNDLFALGSAGTAGSQANANFISLDAIERLKVEVSPYDVRQSGFTGGGSVIFKDQLIPFAIGGVIGTGI